MDLPVLDLAVLAAVERVAPHPEHVKEARFPQTSQSGSAFGGGRKAAGEDGAEATEGGVVWGGAESDVLTLIAVVFPPFHEALALVFQILQMLLQTLSGLS